MKKLILFIFTLLVSYSFLSAQDKTKALMFDGIDDYVLIPHSNTLNLGRSEFTIEAWIKADTGNNGTLAPMVLSKKAPGPSTDGFLFGLKDDGKIALQLEGISFSPGFGGGGPGTPAADLRDGQCHHIAWTRETNGVQDTLNGYQDAAFVKKTRLAAQQIDVSNTKDVWIGWSEFEPAKDVYQFKGMIKEVRIWNFAKTESQIFADKNKHLVGNEAGLIAYWRANENFADSVYDCTTNENHGVQKNGATWGTFCDNLDSIPSSCVPDTSTGPIDTTDTTSVITHRQISDQISIYPNPASKLLYWSSSLHQMADINIYSISQQKLIVLENQNGNDPIDISDLNAGIYFIEFVQYNQHIVKRLLVE